MKLSYCSLTGDTVIPLYCIQGDTNSIQKYTFFTKKDTVFLRVFYLVYDSTSKNNRMNITIPAVKD